MKAQQKAPRYTAEQKQEFLAAMAADKLTLKDAAAKFGVSVASLGKWRGKATKRLSPKPNKRTTPKPNGHDPSSSTHRALELSRVRVADLERQVYELKRQRSLEMSRLRKSNARLLQVLKTMARELD